MVGLMYNTLRVSLAFALNWSNYPRHIKQYHATSLYQHCLTWNTT